jgi:hypothetical protein
MTDTGWSEGSFIEQSHLWDLPKHSWPMHDIVRISKLEAAQRQLSIGIRMLFEGADSVAVYTLLGVASVLFTDLIEQAAPHKSWDKMAQDANNLTSAEYFSIMRKAQNFFKHARNDADAVLEFDPVDTESLAFWAIMNGSELAPMSVEAQVFQLWYIASHSPLDNVEESPLKEAIQLFGDLRSVERTERLHAGKKALSETEPSGNF